VIRAYILLFSRHKGGRNIWGAATVTVEAESGSTERERERERGGGWWWWWWALTFHLSAGHLRK